MVTFTFLFIFQPGGRECNYVVDGTTQPALQETKKVQDRNKHRLYTLKKSTQELVFLINLNFFLPFRQQQKNKGANQNKLDGVALGDSRPSP